jgi:multiple sugar transport system permease protein
MAEATGTADPERQAPDGDPGLVQRLPTPSLSFEMALLLPSIVFLAVISFIPLFALLWMSVMEVGIVAGRSSEFVGLEHYADVLTDARHINSWWTTVLYVGSALVLQTVLGVLLAVSLDAVDRAENVFTSVIIMPMMVAPVVVGLLWDFMLSNTFGLYAFILHQFGLFTETPILASDQFALPALVIMDTWQWTPLIVLIVLARLKSIPNQVYEAAAIDGADPWQRFRYVTYPLIKPAIAIALLLRSMDLLRFFDKIFITTGGGPADATKVIGMFIYEQGLRYQNYGPASALGILLLVVTIVIGFLFVEYFMGGAGDDE